MTRMHRLAARRNNYLRCWNMILVDIVLRLLFAGCLHYILAPATSCIAKRVRLADPCFETTVLAKLALRDGMGNQSDHRIRGSSTDNKHRVAVELPRGIVAAGVSEWQPQYWCGVHLVDAFGDPVLFLLH